jgi:hypothetical protein
LDRLHDGLESNDVEVQVKISDDSVALHLSIRRFRSPDGWLAARVVLRRWPSRAHHADAAGLNGRVPADVAPDL